MMEIRVRKLVPEAKVPTQATKGSVCYDVYSTRRVLLSPMQSGMVPTGLAFELPMTNPLWVIGLDIRPRSGLASRGLIILNSPGTLDNDYRGELQISCMNLSSGNIVIKKGDRVAQVRPFFTLSAEFKEVEELSETKRGEGGFGNDLSAGTSLL